MNNTKPTQSNQRALFATRLGVIATTVGSSVGLGNIWRFPYEAGTNGGFAFILCYVGFILLIGVPVICSEFILGRHTRFNIFGCYRSMKAGKGWQSLGVLGIVASLMILSFYSVVAGWTLEYLWQAITGNLFDLGAGEGGYGAHFDEFSSHSYRPLIFTIGFLLINHAIVRGGVQKGIERMSNVLMPLLFLILAVFCVNSLFMPGAKQGLEFLFKPDFSKITTSVVLSALGQAFFSLSIGLGCMLTYASYFSDKTNLFRSAMTTATLDTVVAVLAGVLIFPAVFTYGVAPAQGPTLVFVVFPSIFQHMAGGIVWAVLFFFMLFVASLTSTISMSEISIAYFCDERKMSRKKACNICTSIALVFGVLCTLSFSGVSNFEIFGYNFNFFDFFNDCSSNVLLPVGGMFGAIYVGHKLDKKIFRSQLTNNGTLRAPVALVRFLLRWVAPAGVAIVLLASLGVI
jgi:NSS family neurotransmitter:Na+ symporter